MSASPNPLSVVVNRFCENLAKVDRLMAFDDIILEFVLAKLTPIAEFQAPLKYVPANVNLKQVYDLIKNVKDNRSMRIHYGEIYNQGLVLVVSHFTSATRELFRAVVVRLIASNHLPRKLQQQKLDLPIGQLVQRASDIPGYIANQLIAHSDMSFQDMQGINRAFRDYCGHDPDRTSHVNNIILGQACRHAVVHNAAVVDDQLINQVSGATPRDLRPTVARAESIRMTPKEVQLIGRSMVAFLRAIELKFL